MTSEKKTAEVAETTDNFSVLNKTKSRLPSLPFESIKNTILGLGYDLSVVFVGDSESRGLNMKYRGKDYIPNVLSFRLDKSIGEIFINQFEARRQARDFDKTFRKLLGFLVIHGMLHLKGMGHGMKMEKLEIFYCKKFKLN